MQFGQHTKEDIQKINERWLGNDEVSLPSDGDICYACPYNRDQNAISTSIFSEHVKNTHPNSLQTEVNPPSHTIILECSIRKGKIKASPMFHSTVIDFCGDNDIEACRTNKKIDPALKLYNNIPLMINSNADLAKGRANGTLCRFLKIKLKQNANMYKKKWDGKLINTVSIDDFEYILCEHYPDSLCKIKTFKLIPESDSAKINLKMQGQIMAIGGVNITQFPVNSNIATTGHKLQGMTKDALIVHSWSYSFQHWIYVVLSRVCTLSGLYLCRKLDENKPITCDEDLI